LTEFDNKGRTAVGWSPGQETSLATPCSNLRSFRSKCTVLKEELATLLGLFGARGIVAPIPPSLRPWTHTRAIAVAWGTLHAHMSCICLKLSAFQIVEITLNAAKAE